MYRHIKIVFLTSITLTAVYAFRASAEEISVHAAPPVIPNVRLSLLDFGAIGDGTTMNTQAFEEAIAALSTKGGGELDVPPGIWLTGPIKLQSHINLHLERGALIQFSGDFNLYSLVVINMKGEKEVDSTSPISGENLEDIAITGEGIIDGGGDAWRPVKKDKLTEGDWKALVASGGVLDARRTTWWPGKSAMDGEKIVTSLRKVNSLNLQDYEPVHQFLRPKMVRLIGCKRVLLQGVTFGNPPNWTLNPALCEDVSILNIAVHSSYAAQNSDALDLESCRHVIIQDSTFDTGDDGICLKSGKDAAGRRIGVPDEDVWIEGCTVYHAHGGFVIGSETSGGMRNIYVDNCTFIGTDNGLRFKSVRGRGGVVENIFISNVRMKNILQNAIDFEMYYFMNGGSPEMTGTNLPPVDEGTPQFRDIHFKNIICLGAQKAMVLEGLPEMPIRNFDFENVSLSAQSGAFITDAEGVYFDNVHIDSRTGEKLVQTRVSKSSLEITP
jgi:polygalacturonase